MQLNEKTDGYVQVDPLDRSDIIFLYRDPNNLPNKVYAYKKSTNGFEANSFADFSTDKPLISGLEFADLDGDGYNDLIVICEESTCPSYFCARAYRNIQGQFIHDDVPLWGAQLTDYQFSCGIVIKISVADLNKDGHNDLIFLTPNNEGQSTGLKAIVFINQNTTPLFTQVPQEIINIETEDTPYITQAMLTDIYGGEANDGGGIALLVSYYFSINAGSNTELAVKVLNASIHQTAPPPPIVQGFLEYDQPNQIWHPHIHLNNRGERDFDHYEIWKFKIGDPNGLWKIVPFLQDTGWTDYTECVDATGGDRPDWNCYYYAKSVDIVDKISIPSQNAYFTVGCIPLCDGCEGGDNPLFGQSQNQNLNNNKTPEKYSLTNYPNPFNPATNIKYSLPNDLKVIIRVYDILGRLVKELVNEYKSAGYHELIFDGTNLASGIYFYELKTSKFHKINKMLLIK